MVGRKTKAWLKKLSYFHSETPKPKKKDSMAIKNVLTAILSSFLLTKQEEKINQ